MRKIRTAVIQAGGKGTRLIELTKDEIPKPLIKIAGKSILEWQIENLKRYGVEKIIIIVGYLGYEIKRCFEDGEKLGVSIEYIEESNPLGSGGSLYFLKEKNIGDDFILIYGDVMFNINWNRMEDFHIQSKAYATLLVHPNTHPFDSDLVALNSKSQVENFLLKGQKRERWYKNCVNAGVYILSKKIVFEMGKLCKLDLEKDILIKYAGKGVLYGYYTTEYVKDAGTVKRFYEVEKAFLNNIPEKRNLANKQKCIFLDRDGTLNVYKGLLADEEEFELEEGTIQALKAINQSEYLAIVVTNQPVVARGMCELEDVEKIHRKMTTLLGNEGVYLDDIIFCPHHPDKGYAEENVKFKIDCECRKPKTGMIDSMVSKYNIDVKQSYMIGDTTVDIQTGINAGLTTVLVHTGEAGQDKRYDISADKQSKNLLEAVKMLLV